MVEHNDGVAIVDPFFLFLLFFFVVSFLFFFSSYAPLFFVVGLSFGRLVLLL